MLADGAWNDSDFTQAFQALCNFTQAFQALCKSWNLLSSALPVLWEACGEVRWDAVGCKTGKASLTCSTSHTESRSSASTFAKLQLKSSTPQANPLQLGKLLKLQADPLTQVWEAWGWWHSESFKGLVAGWSLSLKDSPQKKKEKSVMDETYHTP